MKQFEQSRWLTYVLCFLFFGFVSYSLSYYMALSSKGSNNIFYLGVLFPVLVVFLAKYEASKYLIVNFLFLFLMILSLSLLDMKQAKDIKRGIYLAAFFVGCVLLDQGKERSFKILLPYGLACFLMLIYIAFDWLSIWLETGVWNRYSYWLGEFFHPGFFGILMCFGLVFLWSFYIYKNLKNSWIVQLIALILFVSVVLLCAAIFQSRTALVGFALFMFGWILYEKKYLIGLLALLLITAIIFGFGVDQILANRGVSYRLEIWQEVLRLLFNECNIVIGCTPTGDILGMFSHPHNAYLAMLYRNGLIGAGIFIIFIAYFFYMGIKFKSKWFILSLYGWGALLTESSSLFTSPQPFWIYFWLPVFMTMIEVRKDVVVSYINKLG